MGLEGIERMNEFNRKMKIVQSIQNGDGIPEEKELIGVSNNYSRDSKYHRSKRPRSLNFLADREQSLTTTLDELVHQQELNPENNCSDTDHVSTNSDDKNIGSQQMMGSQHMENQIDKQIAAA